MSKRAFEHTDTTQTLPIDVWRIIALLLMPGDEALQQRQDCAALCCLAQCDRELYTLFDKECSQMRFTHWCIHCRRYEGEHRLGKNAAHCRKCTEPQNRAYVCQRCLRGECDRCGVAWCRCVSKYGGNDVHEYCGGCDRELCHACFYPAVDGEVCKHCIPTYSDSGCDDSDDDDVL